MCGEIMKIPRYYEFKDLKIDRRPDGFEYSSKSYNYSYKISLVSKYKTARGQRGFGITYDQYVLLNKMYFTNPIRGDVFHGIYPTQYTYFERVIQKLEDSNDVRFSPQDKYVLRKLCKKPITAEELYSYLEFYDFVNDSERMRNYGLSDVNLDKIMPIYQRAYEGYKKNKNRYKVWEF